MKPNFSRLNIDIYADGANMKDILYFNSKKFIKGLTTNPSLMKKSGIKDYQKILADLYNAKPLTIRDRIAYARRHKWIPSRGHGERTAEMIRLEK